MEQSPPTESLMPRTVPTKPLSQWAKGREYNRRLKAAFDAHGIEIPFPHTTIYFGEDKQGRAPAGRVVIEDARGSADTPAPPHSSAGDEEEREKERQRARTPRERTGDGPEDAGSGSGDDAPG